MKKLLLTFSIIHLLACSLSAASLSGVQYDSSTRVAQPTNLILSVWQFLTTSNGLFAAETTRNAAVSNALVTLLVANDTTTSNGLFATETTRNAAVSNALVTLLVGLGTNFPTVVTTGTNIVVGTGTSKSLLMPTNASVGISLNGTELSGEQITLVVTNTSATNITISFFQDGVASSYFDATVGTNVNGFLVVSNCSRKIEWVYNGTFWRMETDVRKELDFAVGANLALTTNTANNTVTLSMTGSVGGGADTISNITVSSTAVVLLDLAAANVFKLKMLTNANIIYTNASSLTKRALVYFQQDTNGTRLLSSYAVNGGLLQTNANMQPTTNANALDLLQVEVGFFPTNLLAYWPQNFLPRVNFTNSINDGIDNTMVLQLLPSTVSSVGNGNKVTTWTDTSHFGNHAANTGSSRPTYTASLAGKQAMYFDGNDADYCTIAHSASMNITGDITMMAWVYNSAASSGQFIIAAYDPNSPFHGYNLSLSINNLNHYSIYTDTGSYDDAPTTRTSGAWEHIAVTVSGTTGQFYFNGSADGSTFTSGAPGSFTGTRYIGISPAFAQPLNQGYLRDVRIYNRALSSGEISAIYSANLD